MIGVSRGIDDGRDTPDSPTIALWRVTDTLNPNVCPTLIPPAGLPLVRATREAGRFVTSGTGCTRAIARSSQSSGIAGRGTAGGPDGGALPVSGFADL